MLGPLDSLAGTTLSQFELDLTGSNSYRLNRLGYRGCDYSHKAERHIYVFGCSYTFGTGLNEEELWYSHFAARYSAHLGFAAEDLNILNFGITGASNGEIARQVITQCSVRTPDLALVLFTHPERHERVEAGGVVNIGPWSPEADYLPIELREFATAFYAFYTDEGGALDMFKNILLVQQWAAAAGCDFMTAMAVMPKCLPQIVKPLHRLLDPRRTIWLPSQIHRLIDRGRYNWSGERAADNIHFGAGLHKLAGELIWNKYMSTLQLR